MISPASIRWMFRTFRSTSSAKRSWLSPWATRTRRTFAPIFLINVSFRETGTVHYAVLPRLTNTTHYVGIVDISLSHQLQRDEREQNQRTLSN